MNNMRLFSPFILASSLGLLLYGCTQDPEIAGNDPDIPQLKLDITSRVSAELTIVSSSQIPGISYGAEIVKIVNGEESDEKLSFKADNLGTEQSYTWITSDLQPNTTYNARAYITNGLHRKYSGSKTSTTPSTSKATLSDVVLVGDILTATILDDGGRKIEDVGFVASESTDRKELIRKEKKQATVVNGQTFSIPLSAFRGGKTYFFYAYAIDNQDDTGYGSTPLELWLPLLVEAIIFDLKEVNLEEGSTVALKYSVEPEDATDKTVTWSTSDAEIATVEDGTVTAIKEGMAIITATSGGKTATCSVIVNKKNIPVTSIMLDKTELSMEEGDTETLTATIEPENATDKTVTWNSSDSEVATVNDGTVTAVKEGTAIITASAGEIAATCRVVVKTSEIPVSNIVFSETQRDVYIGEVFAIPAAVSPEDATDKTLTWESSDTDIATVSQDGIVTPVGIGNCAITATAKSGQIATFSCTVVSEAPVFPDPVFREYVYTNYDTNNDGFLSRDEVLAIQRIEVREMTDIASLSGVEYLANLIYLNCDGTNIKSLDITTCSNLVELSCAGTGLVSLDVTNCPRLQRFSFPNSQIALLDGISNCIRLTSISCWNTPITSLDISNCTQLQRINCSDTQISFLDVSNCTQLSSLQCYNIPISSLNVTNCPNLDLLYCSGTQLSSLDVTNCPRLRSLMCAKTHIAFLDVSHCPLLESLDCGDTQVSALNVSSCPNLDALRCFNTNIISLDVSNCSKLRSLRCYKTQITSLDLSTCSELNELRCYNTLISSLDLRNNSKMDDLECYACPNLTDIWLIAGHTYNHLRYDSSATLHYE